jgi:hypothetical protein
LIVSWVCPSAGDFVFIVRTPLRTVTCKTKHAVALSGTTLFLFGQLCSGRLAETAFALFRGAAAPLDGRSHGFVSVAHAACVWGAAFPPFAVLVVQWTVPLRFTAAYLCRCLSRAAEWIACLEHTLTQQTKKAAGGKVGSFGAGCAETVCGSGVFPIVPIRSCVRLLRL